MESEEAAAEAALNAALAKGDGSKSAPAAAAAEPGDSRDAAAAPNEEQEAHSVRKADAAAKVLPTAEGGGDGGGRGGTCVES